MGDRNRQTSRGYSSDGSQGGDSEEYLSKENRMATGDDGRRTPECLTEENQYRRLFESSPVALWREDFSEVKRRLNAILPEARSDIRGYLQKRPGLVHELATLVRIVDVNRATLRLYRAESKSALVQALPHVFTEGSWEVFIEELATIAADGTHFSARTEQRALNGEPFNVELRWSVFEEGHTAEAQSHGEPGESGRAAPERYACLYVSAIDITEQVHTRRRLERSEAFYRALLRSSPLPITSFDLEGNVVTWNDAAEQKFGWSFDEVYGNPLPIIPEDQSEAFGDELVQLRWGQQINGKEVVRVTKRGENVDMLLSASPIRDDAGEFIGFLGVLEDITERKRKEERISALLRQKELVLRESRHRVKNNMELTRALLALQAAEQDEPARSALEEAGGRIRSMMILYDRLYRLEYPDELPLNEFVPPLVAEIAELAGGAKTIETSVDVADIVVRGQVVAPLGLILNELIVNSCKHGFVGRDRGTIQVSITADGGEHGNSSWVTLRYEDDGVGLPDSVRFDEYPAEGDSTLGLRLIWEFVEQLAGTSRREDGPATSIVIGFPP